MNNKYIFGSFNIILSFILILIYIYGLFISTNINFIFISIISILSLLITIIFFTLYFSKNKILYNTSQFISFILNTILIFNIITINDNYNYINNIFNNKYNYKEYNVYVLKNTKYNSYNDLNTKKIGVMEENITNIKDLLSNEFITYSNFNDMVEDLNNGEIQGILVEDINFEKSKYSVKELRNLDTFKIKKNKSLK